MIHAQKTVNINQASVILKKKRGSKCEQEKAD